ncbi:MAG: YebC/PmpR family DNA-binding transcriptional regulator [Patescibacteria group bacterium]|jgi:transcriptional/translational regulatory protein YebC/TACO1|nr:YebC/PmpR family DNA-binding transcriptional regulator [Patescibacteria group bacterium]MDD5172740.1 YebC/PmpR family DNA-binding transcriptional regulator [Patescibacteria group bacterium]
MSGHSKWAKLKHFKGALDAKKSAIFTKLGHAITIAARQGGKDMETNFKLRLAIERAKKANLPKDNIERAIKRGTGELAGEQIEEVIYEAFGPNGTTILIEALTDNKNRTVSSLRRIFNKYGGNLGGQNSVLWMFEKKGVIRILKEEIKGSPEDLELKMIDFGAEDIKNEEEGLVIYIKLEDLERIKKHIEDNAISIESAEIEWFAKDPIKVDESTQSKIDNIFIELDEDQDINSYYTNIE